MHVFVAHHAGFVHLPGLPHHQVVCAHTLEEIAGEPPGSGEEFEVGRAFEDEDSSWNHRVDGRYIRNGLGDYAKQLEITRESDRFFRGERGGDAEVRRLDLDPGTLGDGLHGRASERCYAE
jgi:hypothetical protein